MIEQKRDETTKKEFWALGDSNIKFSESDYAGLVSKVIENNKSWLKNRYVGVQTDEEYKAKVGIKQEVLKKN
jgi:hypothetical protein